MAKGLPYFKFFADVWMLGNISFEDMAVQGLYLNICAFYWHRDGDLSVEEITKRFKSNSELITELTERFFKVGEGGKISIKWLDEQLAERNHVSMVNSENGSKGGRPKGAKTHNKKPTVKQTKSQQLSENTQKNKEEKKTKEQREEERKKDFEARKNSFALTLKPFLGVGEGKYTREFLKEFCAYWTEPNKSGSKFRQESQPHWELARRLETWAKNDKSFGKAPVDPGKAPVKSSLTF